MSITSNVTYSGLNAQNAHRLNDIQMAEGTVSAYYNSLGGETQRTSHWHIDENGNVSHFAIVRKEGVSYEKTIPDSVSAGLMFIQSMEEQLSGTKFFAGTVSYGQIYGNSSDTNFVVNPKFVSKLGTDTNARKQFEEDVQYLNDFSKRFRAQQLARGREIISQGWFCDENGNWGGWSVSRTIKSSSVLQDIKSEETAKAQETEGNADQESTTVSGKLGVNVAKTARKIAAAKTKEQLRTVMVEIRGDMQEVKAGIAKGWCDETEMDKVNSLMAMAESRMGQVEDREATPKEENMFALASLL